jgi:dTDP-L-rhamnose 4-epimerase
MSQIDKILVTGGAGFIGSYTVDLLVAEGYQVRILDNLEPQVHPSGELPEYFNRSVEFIKGDTKDRKTLIKALEDMDAVIHLAAALGVGQSMYQIERFVAYNTYGTANLLDVLVNEPNDVKKLVVGSSMLVYGEGKYHCDSCGTVYPPLRSEERLKNRRWEPVCPTCGREVRPLPTDEEKPLMPTSVYAQTKRHQEEMCLLIGRTYGIPTVALRYFNVYGPRQALSNPYTGVCAIFSSQILNNRAPYIFEDGRQTRDFVHVRDVARANLLALEKSRVDYMAVNVGSGNPISIVDLAQLLIQTYEAKLTPFISYRYRKGDVRHCYADISRARNYLDYAPTISLSEGLRELAAWARAQRCGTNTFEKAIRELEEKRLVT